MTEAMIDLPEAIAKSDDTDFLRELIQDAAQRLMDIEVGAVCGAGPHERTPDRENQRNGYRPRSTYTSTGYPCRDDRAEYSKAEEGKLFPDLPGAAPHG